VVSLLSEEAGTLDLLLAHPVSRTRLVLERFAALAAAVAWLGLVVWAGTLAAARAPDMGIGAGPITAATLGLLGLGFGTVALAAGALSGRRGQVLGSAPPWPCGG
jgi:ABC-2 type transport system permease protein